MAHDVLKLNVANHPRLATAVPGQKFNLRITVKAGLREKAGDVETASLIITGIEIEKPTKKISPSQYLQAINDKLGMVNVPQGA